MVKYSECYKYTLELGISIYLRLDDSRAREYVFRRPSWEDFTVTRLSVLRCVTFSLFDLIVILDSADSRTPIGGLPCATWRLVTAGVRGIGVRGNCVFGDFGPRRDSARAFAIWASRICLPNWSCFCCQSCSSSCSTLALDFCTLCAVSLATYSSGGG